MANEMNKDHAKKTFGGKDRNDGSLDKDFNKDKKAPAKEVGRWESEGGQPSIKNPNAKDGAKKDVHFDKSVDKKFNQKIEKKPEQRPIR